MALFVDIGAWLTNFEQSALKNGDKDRLRLVPLSRSAWQQREKDPHLAKQMLQEGLSIAERLAEKCWVASFYNDIVDVTLYYLSDFKTGLEYAVKNVVRIRTPEYIDCPFRGSICRKLIRAYLNMDPVGHADQIREALHYIETEVQIDK